MIPPIVAFSAEQVCRLTGVSPRQLSHWDRTGFFRPEYGSSETRAAFSRVYSFRDVVRLRVLSILRNQHKVPLQRLRVLGQYLIKRANDPWAEITFYVVGSKVFYDDQEIQRLMSGQSLGQTVIPISMQRVSFEMATEVERLQKRSPEEFGRIVRNRYVVHNEPVLEGTRIPTRSIWNLHVAGYSEEAILHEYPNLAQEDVVAAIKYESRNQKQKAG